MKRLFIAINIYPNQTLLEACNDLQARCNRGRIKWVDASLFHLTLKFIGETPEDKIDIISKTIKNVTDSTNSFSFDLKGIGIFGSTYRPRIIRVNINNDEHLIRLGNNLRFELEQAGFPNDRQNFVPHLTLARIKQVQDKTFFQKSINLYKEVFFQTIDVHEIFLYESILHPHGPEYVVLDEYKLL